MVLSRLLTILALASCPALPASARPINAWFADDLAKNADVVVMATVLSNKDAWDFSKEQHKPDDLVPVITTFSVDAVLKGEVPGKIKSPQGVKIEVEHRRYFDPMSHITVIDGAFLTRFDSEKHPHYLMFLQKEGTRFVPVTGQYDSYQSFIELGRYFSVYEETSHLRPDKPTEPQVQTNPNVVAPPK